MNFLLILCLRKLLISCSLRLDAKRKLKMHWPTQLLCTNSIWKIHHTIFAMSGQPLCKWKLIRFGLKGIVIKSFCPPEKTLSCWHGCKSQYRMLACRTHKIVVFIILLSTNSFAAWEENATACWGARYCQQSEQCQCVVTGTKFEFSNCWFHLGRVIKGVEKEAARFLISTVANFVFKKSLSDRCDWTIYSQL